MKATMFEPNPLTGELLIEWKLNKRGYGHARVKLAKLSKTSLKRLICWIIGSGAWYLDYGIDYHHEEYGYGTSNPGKNSDLEPLTAGRIVRWIVSAR